MSEYYKDQDLCTDTRERKIRRLYTDNQDLGAQLKQKDEENAFLEKQVGELMNKCLEWGRDNKQKDEIIEKLEKSLKIAHMMNKDGSDGNARLQAMVDKLKEGLSYARNEAHDYQEDLEGYQVTSIIDKTLKEVKEMEGEE